jgi:hypothetical protein
VSIPHPTHPGQAAHRSIPAAVALPLIRDRAERLTTELSVQPPEFAGTQHVQALAGVVLDLADVVNQLIDAAAVTP